MRLRVLLSTPPVAALALAAPPAAAQVFGSTGGSAFNSGYNSASGEFSQPISVSRKADGSGNTVVIDGVTKTGDDQSVFYAHRTGGAGDSYGGVGGQGAATAVGNNLVVSVQGSNNTVIVNSTQTNTGSVTAQSVLNGKVNLDGTDGGE